MKALGEYLFNDPGMDEKFETYRKQLFDEIDNFNNNLILDGNPDELCKHLQEKHCISPAVLNDDETKTSCKEIQIDVSQDTNLYISDRSKPFLKRGFRLSFHIPFEGHEFSFNYQPSTFTCVVPRGRIIDNTLILSYEILDGESNEKVKDQYNKDISSIKKWLGWVANDIDKYNSDIAFSAKSRLEERIKSLKKRSELISQLGFPAMDKKISKTYAVTLMPKHTSRNIHEALKGKTLSPLEPTLEVQMYENILSILKDFGKSMERTPEAFTNLPEEHIRDLFLAQINSHFSGCATGETFNVSGKTDILLRYNNQNIFIAECKIWHGAKALLDAVDQILGYTSWRDTKTAILLFNKNKDLTKVLRTIGETIKTHPNFLTNIDAPQDNCFRLIFHHNNDKERELYLAIMVFEIPQ